MHYNHPAESPPACEPVETRLEIGPNAALSVRQAWLFLGVVAVMGMGVSAGFALLGFWLVLPFAGMELGALGAALYVSMRRNRYREVLVFGSRQLRVEFGELGRGAIRVIDLPRAATRVLVERGANPHAPTGLWLSCAGRRVRIGACLTDVERDRLAARIKQLLTPAWADARAGTGAGPADKLPLGE